jgi:hypothetical protein
VYVNTAPIVTNVSTSANIRNKSETSNFFIINEIKRVNNS